MDSFPNCFVTTENPGALKTAFTKNKDCRNLFHVLDTPNGIYFDPPRSNLIDEDNLVRPDKWGVTTQQAENNGRDETKEPANGQSALLENFLSFSRNEAE